MGKIRPVETLSDCDCRKDKFISETETNHVFYEMGEVLEHPIVQFYRRALGALY